MPSAPGQRVLIVDDLLATGGTVSGTIELVRRLQGDIVGLGLPGRAALPQGAREAARPGDPQRHPVLSRVPRRRPWSPVPRQPTRRSSLTRPRRRLHRARSAVPGRARVQRVVARRRFFRAFSRDTARAAIQVAGMAMAFQRGTGAPPASCWAWPSHREQALGRLSGEFRRSRGRAAGPAPPFRSPYRVEGERSSCSTSVGFPGASSSSAAARWTRSPRPRPYAPHSRRPAARPACRLRHLAGGPGRPGLAAAPARGAQLPARRSCCASRPPTCPPWPTPSVRSWPPRGPTTRSVTGRRSPRTSAPRPMPWPSPSRSTMRRLVQAGMAALEQPVDRPLEILTLDSTGRPGGRPRGYCAGHRAGLAAAGREVHVWLLETRPYRSGARLAAWELGSRACPRRSCPTRPPAGCWRAPSSTPCSWVRTASPPTVP